MITLIKYIMFRGNYYLFIIYILLEKPTHLLENILWNDHYLQLIIDS